jgi:tetratricopeptide (TPR) repeat protein
MIIWIRNRRGWIGGVFFLLIGIFALSFVIGGVGTGNNASLSDIFGNSGGGSSASTTPTASSIGSLQKKVKAQPTNAQAWTDLANAYASASRASDEATAWGHVAALKPGNSDTLQRLALAQAQVATNQTNQATQLQQEGLSSSPGNDSTFQGGTLGTLSEDPVTQAQAAASSDQQSKLLSQASTYAQKASVWWKRSTATYGKIVALPSFSKNDLAATIWLNYGSAAQSARDTKTAIKAYEAFLKLAPDDVNAPQVKSILKQLKPAVVTTTSGSSTTTTSG